MNLIVGVVTWALVAVAASANFHCDIPSSNVPTQWIDMSDKCTNFVKLQIQKEVEASFAYLAMAAHFARDTINRPGFAKHYFEAAKEERSHAMVLIDYLTMRGKLTDGVTDLIKIPTVEKLSWGDAAESLTDALNLETNVTEHIRQVISVCENDQKKTMKFNDYHLVDYLTGVYLEEQYKGEREIAGKLSTLNKMMADHGEIGEFLFDKTLME